MAFQFPALVPSSRRFVALRWPVTSNRSQSGVKNTRLWGSAAGDGELQLGFNNIRDDLADAIVDAHEASKGGVSEVLLPAEVFMGTAGNLRVRLVDKLKSQGVRWYFKENDPPVVESVVPGISSVRVNLSAELRMS